MTPRKPQTWQFLQGDLEPHRADWTDLRNDYAGDELQQAKSIVLRYLQCLPAEDTVNLQTMMEDISRHYPFHNEGLEFFRKAVKDLQSDKWVKTDGDEIKLNKIARVAARYLLKTLQRSR